VKTVRFSKVIEKSGQPETHLLLVEPAKDRVLQAAIKAQRVMTVRQESVGTKADQGEIGFHPGGLRQFFVFPKSLRSFEGRTVVGIKYDLIGNEELPENERATAPKPPKKTSPKTPTPSPPEPKPALPRKAHAEKPRSPAKAKVVPFKHAPAEDEEDEDIAELKKHVRHAMAVLEDGKAVAAFNLLKRIVEN